MGIGLAIAIFVAVVGYAYWKMTVLERELVRSNAIEHASRFSEAISEFRTLYTSEVVANVSTSGVQVTHDYREHPGSIPLPATLSMLLGNRLASLGGGDTRLYSDHPFPWRSAERGGLSQLDRETIETLRRDPTRPVVRFDSHADTPEIHYATADLMRESCVNCHNSHPDSPKTDWQVGDVRGVVEVTIPLSSVISRTRQSFASVWWLVGGAALVLLAVLSYLGGLIVDRSRALVARESELDDEVQRRTVAEVALERSEVRKSFILDSADEAIVAMDAQGTITEFNSAATRIFGLLPEQATGNTFSALIAEPGEGESAPEPLSRFSSSGDARSLAGRFEARARHADGTDFPVQISISEAERDGVLSVIACLHDISEQMKREERLQTALNEAEESREALEAFNHFSVDRELRMVDLKREINSLLEDGGEPPRYDVSEDAEADEERGVSGGF